MWFLVFSPNLQFFSWIRHRDKACWVLGSIGARPETTDALVAVLLREAELVETVDTSSTAQGGGGSFKIGNL